MPDRAQTARVARRAFRGAELSEVSAQARAALGDDALILSTRVLRGATGSLVEIVAASARDVRRFEHAITPEWLPGGEGAPASSPPGLLAPAARPFVLALVGPTGAGKTTTAVKLATHPDAFGSRRVGLLTLDTYRAGAVAQLETFADVAGLPLEVAYDARDAAGALARLAACDVVVIDTPGRGPREEAAEWRAALAALAPAEVHLVLPATMRADLAEHVRASYDATVDDGPRLSHLLLTKLDEVPGDVGVADVAAQLGLPTRWITDGQEIPTDVAAAVPRLVHALGATSGAPALASALAPGLAAPAARARAEAMR
jgi:flagellar biosynthesis protein FlhF